MRIYKPNFSQIWQVSRDIIFRLGLRRGIRLNPPDNLCSCTLAKETDLSRLYRCEIETSHPMAAWLLLECEGAWAIGMYRPRRNRRMYLAFARPADAAIFRLMQNH